jgi:hypothetical protein
VRIIHVLRKPLSEGTVASNVLKHGCGGLNIDASRIGTEQVPINRLEVWSGFGQKERPAYVATTSKGRWPANVILQHLDGCRCDGVKRVKACGVGSVKRSTGKENGGQTGASYGAESRTAGTEMINYADKDGKETVANWLCEPDCPVARLDEQSGVIKGVVRQPTGKAVYPTEAVAMKWNSNSVTDTTVRGFGDTGGASRFYKQVGGSGE